VSRTLAYQYDPAGSRTRITHPDTSWFGTVRDVLGRPFWLSSADPAAGVYYQAYFPDGLPGSRSGGNGAATWVSRDGVGRLNGLGLYYGAGGANDATWLYDFNPASQIRSVNRDNDAYAWTGHYAVSRAYTTNGLNQYTASGSVSPTSDARGDLDSAAGSYYLFTADNLLYSAWNQATLSYDPAGRLH